MCQNKPLNKIKSARYITPLLLITLGACTPAIEKDQTQLCTLATNQSSTEDASKTLETILTQFSPESTVGKELKASLTSADTTTIYPTLSTKLTSPEQSNWSCNALHTLHQKAMTQANTTRCNDIKSAINTIAYSLSPLFEEEIPRLIKSSIPEDKQAEVLRIFKQELAVKTKMAESSPDLALAQNTDEILKLTSCDADAKPSPPTSVDCDKINTIVPSLTRNRRIILIGEAYGESLTQTGLDPSKYSKALQMSLVELAKTRMIQALQPGMDQLANATQCTFK